MSVKEQIREYRNTHPETRVVLGVLLSEIDRGFNPSQVTDEDCYKAIRFMMKANIETGNIEENKTYEAISYALEHGVNFFDLCCSTTGVFREFGRAVKGRRNSVFERSPVFSLC